ncbi:TrbI/VirB10 family protein [Pelagibacterium sp. 26DY04]|uniref:TrbI/VirB10 family protein n=1 Tax=Pelagibacterium sp. 26DY04 TaxID=2967130 RepID=UPI0028165A3C|nr:TrbI/VirB10 family protein [Pelagibacterium sp. 26DY04]WMT86441.1 TrbI/VirB10 family protein [Pelagibacterium sp. 26DY04]
MSDAPDIRAELRLQPEKPRVTRLSRRVIIGLAGVSGVAVLGALIWALDTNRRSTDPGQELFNIDNRPTAEGLNTLPSDYAGIPQLGPALPGDLGRAILETQDRGQPVVVPSFQPPEIESEEQARLAEIESARLSQLFVGANTAVPTQSLPSLPQLTMPDLIAPVAAASPLPLDAGAARNMQDRKLDFLTGEVDTRAVSDQQLMLPASPYLVQAGAIIPAALITGIRSDLPGQITAQVTSPVYDTPTGRYLLIPQGARLIGRYDSQIAFGQSRVLLVWDRLILPNGRSILLDNQPGTDTMGFAGLEDEVDFHWGRIFQAAALSTLLGIGTNLGSSGEESEIAAAIRESAQGAAQDVGQQIVQRQINIQPTLTIRPGFPVRILVNRDLVLEPYQG